MNTRNVETLTSTGLFAQKRLGQHYVQKYIGAVRNLNQDALPSMLRIAFNDKVLNDWRHHQRCTAQKEIACQQNHVVEGVLVRHAKDHGTDDD